MTQQWGLPVRQGVPILHLDAGVWLPFLNSDRIVLSVRDWKVIKDKVSLSSSNTALSFSDSQESLMNNMSVTATGTSAALFRAMVTLVLSLLLVSAATGTDVTGEQPSSLRDLADLNLVYNGTDLDLSWPGETLCISIYTSTEPWSGWILHDDHTGMYYGVDNRTHLHFPADSIEHQFFHVIHDLPPVAAIAGPDSLAASFLEDVTFDATPSSDPEGQALSFRWENSSRPTVFGPVLTLPEPQTTGSASWFLIVNDGCQDSAPVPVYVEYYDPLPDGVCLSPMGNDSNPGTWDAPLATFGEALDRIGSPSGIQNIFVTGGIWTEDVELVSSVSIYGGFSADFHQRDWTVWQTQLFSASSGAAIKGNGHSVVTLEGLELNGMRPGSGANARSVYGLMLVDMEDVTIRNCILRTQGGQAGQSGNNGTQGSNGTNGSNGGRGCENGLLFCDTCARPLGGAGGASPAGTPGGLGGRPGLGGTGGEAGLAGVGHGGGGGSGGNSTNNGNSGANGTAGSTGAAGQSGGPGSYTSEGFMTDLGTPGATGNPGGGGGGGGAGGGGYSGPCTTFGSGGGGGGGGAAGGSGGQAGRGSGGSFCLYLYECNGIELEDNLFIGTQPEAGGNGGAGGPGGQGGDQGFGGTYRTEQGTAGLGGRGGLGGDGGTGGAGGPGSGGPCWQIVRIRTTNFYRTNNQFINGPGGPGGTSPGGSVAPAGSSGSILLVP